LLDILAAAVWTDDLAFFVVNKGQDFVEGLLAVAAQEFEVGHGDLPSDESNKRILGALIGSFNVEAGIEQRTLNPPFSLILFLSCTNSGPPGYCLGDRL
jgi:hypothetical protein